MVLVGLVGLGLLIDDWEENGLVADEGKLL